MRKDTEQYFCVYVFRIFHTISMKLCFRAEALYNYKKG